MKHFNKTKRALLPLFLMLFGAFVATAQPLSGTYTIGGTSPSYADLSTAIGALNSNGVSGPVIFNIRTGTYTGSTAQGSIGSIVGASATNTITFQAESGPGNVTLSPAGTSSTNYVFRLNGANYVTIKDLTLSNTGTTYGADVELAGSASYNTVTNCILTGNTSTSTSTSKSRIYANNNTGTSNTISNNSFPAGSSYAVYLYGSSSPRPTNTVISNNTVDAYLGFTYSYFNNDLKIRNNTVTKTTSGSFNNIYLYECDSALEISGNTATASGMTGTTYGIYRYYSDGSMGKMQVIKNNTFNFTSTSTMYSYYCQYNNFDSVYNNTFNATSTTTNYVYFNYGGNYNRIVNNTINITTTGAAQVYYQYNYNYDFSYNKITATSTGSGATYGLYLYNNSGSVTNGIISNNTIKAISATGSTVYGLYTPYGSNLRIFNNAIYTSSGSTSGTCYTFYNAYNMADNYVYNNTIVNGSNSTSTGNMAVYSYNYDYYGAKTFFYNNVIAKTGSNGRLLYLYSGTPNMADRQIFDYNNLYTPGAQFAYNAYSGAVSADFPAWRSATGNDKNSLSYPPAFTNASTGDLTPDVTSSNCWSMHGRGNHIAGNNKDINNNNRPTSPGAGVPDLGAYEFVPNSGVIPPLCAVNAAPSAGGTQVYTFGYDSVATITWDAAATVPATSPECRQYTGVVPPGLSALNPTNMYFYTSISSSTNADYESNIYYKDPWIGTIATDAALHLAKKDGTNPWVGYPISISGANTVRNFIYSPASPKLNTYGLYTGIDVANNASAAEITNPGGFFCAGTYPVAVRIKNNGNNVLNSVKINWQLNGGTINVINYTTPIPINNGVLNSNSAVIPLGNIAFGAAANVFKIWTSDPNATTDPISADDTLNASMRAALNGTYTVGGTTPHFATFEAFVDDINKYGICGPVTVNVRPGTYTSTKYLELGTIIGSSSTNRITIQSENGNASSVIIRFATATSQGQGYTLNLKNSNYVALKNLSFVAASGSYGYALGINGTSHNDSVIGCVLTTALTTSSYFGGMYCTLTDTCSNLVIQKNTLSGGYYGLYLYGTSSKFTRSPIVEGNTVRDAYMGLYLYYSTNYKVNDNIVYPTANSYYGMYISNYTTSPVANNFVEVNRNKVLGINNGYGLMLEYPQGYLSTAPTTRSKITNNVICGTGTGYLYYGMYAYYPSNADIYNNSINITNSYTSCYGAMFYLSSAPYNNNYVKNNAFINTGGGYAYYMYSPSGYGNQIDYNNIYGSGSAPIYEGYYTGGHANFGSYRTAIASYGFDQNSISYAPGFTSATDLRPDPTNANTWSLNGRGVQIAGNDKDIEGNPRPTALADGVPDIGAYEFEPTALPPAATAVPATAAPGVTQVFTFAYQKVATVKWNTALALTAPLTVRQYSGRVPPANFTTVSGGTHQYFYTDIIPNATGTTYDFDLTVNYMDTWMGTIASEPDLKLAHRFGSNPWISYNSANSIADAPTNKITAAGVTSFGSFTGIPDGVNFSAIVKPASSPVICTGNSVVLNASPVSGGSTTYTYVWYRNGTVIPGATSASYTATLGGDYAVTITGTQSATSIPVTVTVTAPPMASVAVNGALTFCTGSQLALNASSPVNVLSYQWQLNGADIPGATSPNYDVKGAGSYSLVVTNIGCSDTSSAVVVNAGPIVVNLGSDINACELANTPYILDAGYPGSKYTWSTGDTTQTIEIYKGSGTYSVQVDAGPNCQGSDVIEVNIKPLPSATGINTIRTNNTYTFSPAGTENVTKLMWIFGDGTTNTANTVTKTFDGNMVVKLVVYNDCGSDTLQMMQWATGITKTENGSINASLYPNPATEKTLLSVDGAKIEDVTILNAVGQVVYRATLEVKSATIELPVNNLAAGRYIVRATTTEGIISKPLNVQR